jgi:hypothetical protein
MYTFIKHNGGWWLKITSVEEYLNAKLFENEMWNEAAEQLGDFRRNKHFHFTNAIASLIYDFRCPRTGSGIIKETATLIEEISSQQLEMLNKHGKIYINKNGGYCFRVDESEKIEREDLIYPDSDYYKVDIKKFPYGSHYYLYINGKQIYDEFGNIKWHTYKRAKEIADIYLKKKNRK